MDFLFLLLNFTSLYRRLFVKRIMIIYREFNVEFVENHGQFSRLFSHSLQHVCVWVNGIRFLHLNFWKFQPKWRFHKFYAHTHFFLFLFFVGWLLVSISNHLFDYDVDVDDDQDKDVERFSIWINFYHFFVAAWMKLFFIFLQFLGPRGKRGKRGLPGEPGIVVSFLLFFKFYV